MVTRVKIKMSEADIDEGKISEILDGINTDFLKQKKFKGVGLKQSDLIDDFKKFLSEELLPDRPDLLEDPDMEIIQSIAERTYSAASRRRLVGGASEGKLIILGATKPLNYVELWRRKKKKKFDAAKAKASRGNNQELKKMIEDGEVDKNGTPLEHRDNPPVGEKGKAYAAASSHLCNIFGVFIERSGKKRTHIFSTTLGGEINDDPVNIVCPQCGQESPWEVCRRKTKTGKICGYKKQFFEFENICRAGFCEAITKLKVTDVEGQAIPSIRWTNETDVSGCSQFDKSDLKKLLTTTLKTKTVQGKDLVKVWNDHKDEYTHWIVYVGTVMSIGRKPDGRGNYKVELDDVSLELKNSEGVAVKGVPVYIPYYIWQAMDGDTITNYCQLAVVGKVSRREKGKYQNKRWVSLPGQYRDPEIEVYGFVVLDGGKKRKIERDVTEGDLEVGFDGSSDALFDPSAMSGGSTVVNDSDDEPTTPRSVVVEDEAAENDDESNESGEGGDEGGDDEDDWV